MLSDEAALQLVALFGSHAEDRAHAHSDVDLAVAWEPETDAREREAIISRIERALGHPVDVVDLQQAPPLLRMEIARSGMLLVERIPHAWSDEDSSVFSSPRGSRTLQGFRWNRRRTD